MHPNLAQGIAAERRADMRRDADAYRRARTRPEHGRRQATQEQVALSAAAERMAAERTPAAHTPGDRSVGTMLVLPDGTTETAEPADLCSAGR